MWKKSKGGKVEEITIDDFAKVQLKVGEIIEAKPHPDANKLLVLQIKIGEETRQIVSGIAKHYSADNLIGLKVVVVCNLKPVKLRGIESQGMVLAASNKKELNLVTIDGDIAPGNLVG